MANAPDPVTTFLEYKQREAAQAELDNYTWSLSEVEALQAAGQSGDNDAALRFAALKPAIDASHDRGDFRWPYELSREEAREYLDSKGVGPGEPWSVAELTQLAADRDVYSRYRDEIQRVQEERRLITGPNTHRGAKYHFGDEDEATMQKRLQEKLQRVDRYRQAAELIDKAVEQLHHMQNKNTRVMTIAADVERSLEEINRLDHKLYPVSELKGYSELAEAYREYRRELGV